MGKNKKLKVSKNPGAPALPDQIQRTEQATSSGRVKERSAHRFHEEQDEEHVVQGRISKQILRQAEMQRLEEEEEEKAGQMDTDSVINKKKKPLRLQDKSQAGDSDVSSDEEDEEEENFDDDRFDTDVHINPKDEELFRMFMNPALQQRRTFGQIIAEKISEKKTEIDTQFTDAESLQRKEHDPELVEMYEKVGKVLSMYRSGKIPKAFKVIPKFRHWEDFLNLTNPDQWSAAAMFKATKLFTSNLKANMAQRFFNQYLLPRVRDDIDTYQRLNFHLYQAIKKALFKPGAFFKGFLLPLCESGDCTLREAIIIGSALARNSIPMLHSSAVMLKIAEMEYSGASSIFLRVFFDKKYALPYRVVDAVVHHFLKFRTEKRGLPVLWHQSFLTFAQRYKNSISSEQRDALLEILRIHSHHKITPEIRRELEHATCRDLEAVEPPMEPMEN